ncbi:unnamed protein product [Meloidogyne enterolobii]|uniref:Uncharacterized protein n=1 Tax=Meloidogyne enterolobii TaxID=390850 RepID=A0ACB0Y7Y0_MELEN
MSMRRRRIRNHRNRSRQNNQTITPQIHHLQPPPPFFIHHPPIFNQNPLAQNTSGTGVFLPNSGLYSSINQHNHSQRIYHQSSTIPIPAPAPLMTNHQQNPSFLNVHQLPSIYQPNYPQLRQHSGIRFHSQLNPYAKEYIPIKYQNIYKNPHFNPYQPETSTFHQNGSN